MSDTDFALGRRATQMFAGVPVSDFTASLDWYQRLLGRSPSFRPNEREAVWALADHQWIYIILAPARAGASIQTIMYEDLEAVIAEIADRGLSFEREERPDEGVRKVMYYDPDGNEIGLARVPKE